MEVHPTGGLPQWASGVSGAAAIVEPTALQKQLGWQSNTAPPAAYFNWLHAQTYQWLSYLKERWAASTFGDGSFGDLVLGATLYQLQANTQFQNVAVGPSSILDLNGYIPWIRGALTGVSGVIRSNGGLGGNGTFGGGNQSPGAGGIPGAGPLAGGYGGGTGIIGITLTGQSIMNALGGAGGGGGSGAAETYTPGAGGAAIGPSGVVGRFPDFVDGIVKWFVGAVGTGLGSPTFGYLRGGAGGGAGGGSTNTANYGGGGGAGAGVALLFANEINFQGTIQARGGTGGMPGAGAQGGGGGGGGGRVVICYGKKTTMSVFVDTAGGPGGLSGGVGAPGQNGVTGMTAVQEINLT